MATRKKVRAVKRKAAPKATKGRKAAGRKAGRSSGT